MKIKDTDDKQLNALLFNEVARAYKIAGYKMPNSNELIDIITLFNEELHKELGNCDTDIIAPAMRKGSVGSFGDYAGLSVKNFIGWIKSYTAGDGRTNRVVYEDEPHKELDEAEKKIARRELLENCYGSFIKGQPVYVPGSVLLRALIADNLIDMVDERLEWARESARENLKTEAAQERRLGQTIDAYINSNLESRAAQKVVNGFFRELKNTGKQTIYGR